METIIVNVSRRMKEGLSYLQILAKSKSKLRKILNDNVPDSVNTAICECWPNLLKDVFPLTPRQKRRLPGALANKKGIDKEIVS